MKTFTAVLLLAAYASAKKLPPTDLPEPDMGLDEDLQPVDDEA